MTDKAKQRVKELLNHCGSVEVEIVDENDQYIRTGKYTEYNEAVSDIEFEESVGNQCYL